MELSERLPPDVPMTVNFLIALTKYKRYLLIYFITMLDHYLPTNKCIPHIFVIQRECILQKLRGVDTESARSGTMNKIRSGAVSLGPMVVSDFLTKLCKRPA